MFQDTHVKYHHSNTPFWLCHPWFYW